MVIFVKFLYWEKNVSVGQVQGKTFIRAAYDILITHKKKLSKDTFKIN